MSRRFQRPWKIANVVIGLKSDSSNDSTYTALEDKLREFTTQRDALAEQVRSMLEEAAFGRQAIEETQARALISAAESLLDQVHGAVQP